MYYFGVNFAFFFAFDTVSQISNKGNFITSKFEVILI